MLPALVKASLVGTFVMVTVITLQITLPTIMLFDDQFYFKSTKLTVIRVFICLTAVIVLEMIVIYFSISFLYLTTKWIVAVYIPLLTYAIYHTYKICIVYLANCINDKEAKAFLLKHWNSYIEHDDQFWFKIQLKLNCCGLDGPRTYLDYLRKVHSSCYADQLKEELLIIRGCYDVVYDHFNGVRFLAMGLAWFALLLQLLMLGLYAGVLIKKYQSHVTKLQKLSVHFT